MSKPYKPEQTYSPIGAIPEEEARTEQERKKAQEKPVRAAETSRVERRGGDGLTMAEDERQSAGGDRDQ